MVADKLNPTEAAELMVEYHEKSLTEAQQYLEDLRTELSGMRKNAKGKNGQLARIEQAEKRVQREQRNLIYAQNILPVADKINELTKEIEKLCQSRNALTPDQVGAEVRLSATMRNGFV